MRRFRFFLMILMMSPALLTLSFDRPTEVPENTTHGGYSERERIKFPYRRAKLTERQAAAHLLSRFTYGAKKGDVDKVVRMGLEKWFRQQLDASLPDDSLNQMLNTFDALKLSNAQIADQFPRGGEVKKMLVADGIISKDSINASDKKEYRLLVGNYMKQKGLRPERELFEEFSSQKILRAAYSQNQLKEVLTDFWFNHFNVSFTKNEAADFIPAYERDVIRPNVLGKFQDLLLGTAKSPAMLTYLDNFSSTGTNTTDSINNSLRETKLAARMALMSDTAEQKINYLKRLSQPRRPNGLNENYAREVMELHTLGVDGGYTQQDVTQAAKVLTGWSIYPIGQKGYGTGQGIRASLEKMGPDKMAKAGFVHEGDFLFNPTRHDNREKIILGKRFPAGGGYQEGVDLLEMLAHHPSAAAFISRKLAVRFVSDNPPQSLIDQMKQTFLQTNGDIRQVLIAMCNAPEFWDKNSLREKTKSPFELAISALRALDVHVDQPMQIYNWVNRMGQKIYYYQAPTGFPDRGQYWINTGALLNRMNFGLALASERIPGAKVDLLKLNQNHEPESSEAALLTYSTMILPERDLGQTIERLKPLLNDPKLSQKVNEAAGRQPAVITAADGKSTGSADTRTTASTGGPVPAQATRIMQKTPKSDNAMLAQVVGVILGSPEFQRR